MKPRGDVRTPITAARNTSLAKTSRVAGLGA
jgi:hypothetical protein